MATPAGQIKGIVEKEIKEAPEKFPLLQDYDMFIGPLPEDANVRSNAVTFIDYGGGTGHPGYRLDFPAVQIFMRSRSTRYDGVEVMTEVKDIFMNREPEDLEDGSETRIVATNVIGDINFIGADENNQQYFTLNIDLITEPGDPLGRSKREQLPTAEATER